MAAFSIAPCEIIGDSKCLILCRSRQGLVSLNAGAPGNAFVPGGFDFVQNS